MSSGSILPRSSCERSNRRSRRRSQAIRLRGGDLDPHAGPFPATRHGLQQVMWNLLTNAVQVHAEGRRVQVLLNAVNSHFERQRERQRRGDRTRSSCLTCSTVSASRMADHPATRRAGPGPVHRETSGGTSWRKQCAPTCGRREGSDVHPDAPDTGSMLTAATTSTAGIRTGTCRPPSRSSVRISAA